MRGLGVVLSVAAHAGALAVWLAHAPDPAAPPVAPAPAPTAVATAPEPDPIEVVMLDAPATAAAEATARGVPSAAGMAAAPSRAEPRATPGSVAAFAASLGRAPTESPDLRPRPPGPAAPRDLWKMRIGPQVHSSIDDLVASAAELPTGAPPPPEPVSGILRDSGNGVVHGEHSAFSMRVAHDGTVAFADHGNVGVDQYGQPFERELQTWIDEPGIGPIGKKPPTVDTWGSIDPDDHSGAIILPMVGGHFDATDAIMRARGEDPYARAKLAMLDATRDERVRMGKAERTKQLARTPVLVAQNVARVFAQLRDPAEQRAALFQLWDECSERGDAQALAATVQARAFIVSAIRRHFPADSRDAYTADELARFDRGRSAREPFAPYSDAAIAKAAN